MDYINITIYALLIFAFFILIKFLFNGDSKITVKASKIRIENSSDQLGVLLRDLVDAVKGIVTVGSSTTQTVDGASQTALENAILAIEGLIE